MSSSKTRRNRLKAERAGGLNPDISRRQWQRKPQTQVIRNEKAEQRRSYCRKAREDGADFYTSA